MARKVFGKINVDGGVPPGYKLRVHAWDADRDEDDQMGSVPVNQDGSYVIEYADKEWDWAPTKLVSTWRPDIYVVVEWYDSVSDEWKQVAKSKVYSDQDVRVDCEINIAVDLPHTNAHSIYGRLTSIDDSPLTGYTVTGWDEISIPGLAEIQPAPSEGLDGIPMEFIGSTVTDNEGFYQIHYDSERFEISLERTMQLGLMAYRRPDFYIQVHGKDEQEILHRSPTRQNIISVLGCRIDAKISKVSS